MERDFSPVWVDDQIGVPFRQLFAKIQDLIRMSGGNTKHGDMIGAVTHLNIYNLLYSLYGPKVPIVLLDLGKRFLEEHKAELVSNDKMAWEANFMKQIKGNDGT